MSKGGNISAIDEHRREATKWVNLTAHQIHHELTIKDGFVHSWVPVRHTQTRDAPQILFYLNHPIQFVQVVGIVVSFEEWFERFWLFTIDDSSGSTIDVVCRKPEKQKAGDLVSKSNDEDEDEVSEILRLSQQVEHLNIGVVLQVKGTITLFQRAGNNYSLRHQHHIPEKPTRQITLQRLTIVHDTNQEVDLIAARILFYTNVLRHPWHLNQKELKRLHMKALGESETREKHEKKRTERKRKANQQHMEDARRIQRKYDDDEIERAAAAAEARRAGELLKTRLLEHGSKSTRIDGSIQSNTVAKPGSERNRQNGTGSNSGKTPFVSAQETGTSFGIDEDERSALLRAAFGT